MHPCEGTFCTSKNEPCENNDNIIECPITFVTIRLMASILKGHSCNKRIVMMSKAHEIPFFVGNVSSLI